MESHDDVDLMILMMFFNRYHKHQHCKIYLPQTASCNDMILRRFERQQANHTWLKNIIPYLVDFG